MFEKVNQKLNTLICKSKIGKNLISNYDYNIKASVPIQYCID